MKKHKILNDPVYGFITLPYGTLFDIVEHPYFQRLRRIKQVSLTHYVYPGAMHTRFLHALGAFHLVRQSLDVLISKGIEISEAECEAVCVAILLHDIGHGPFSHTLEHTLIQVHHETLSLLFMQRLNEEFRGRLDLAIRIFRNQYDKPFLHQLVSGQLDMDRMDYLNRDSYFTGVSEGVIGYDRIIKMLNVRDGQLVVEQKGIYSIEKFLIARRLMYWQVYLHKTVLAAELMLVQTLKRARHLIDRGETVFAPPALAFFLNQTITADDFIGRRDELLDHFARLDDTDLASAIKAWQTHGDGVLSYLAWGLANRKLFRLRFLDGPASAEELAGWRQQLNQSDHYPAGCEDYFLVTGQESNTAYSTFKDEIRILTKDERVLPMSQVSDFGVRGTSVTKYYVMYPKGLDAEQ